MYMIRKQLYIYDYQEQRLKQRARELGLSEAEFVRQALNVALNTDAPEALSSQRRKAIDDFLETAREISVTSRPIRGERWRREDFYDSRGGKLAN